MLSFEDWTDKYEDEIIDAIEDIGVGISASESRQIEKSLYSQYVKSCEDNEVYQ